MAKLINTQPREFMTVSIMHVGNLLEGKLSPLMKRFSITNAQYNILRILNGSYPIALNVNDIKQRMMYPSSDVTRLLDRLVEKQLVDRRFCEHDRRKVELKIAPEGKVLLQAIRPELESLYSNFFEQVITEEEANNIIDQLLKIKNNIQNP